MTRRIATRGRRALGALGALTLVAVLGAVLAAPAPARTAAARTAAAQGPGAASLASRYAATIRDGRATAKQLLAQSPGASLSLALVRDGRVIWQQGFGYADRATQTPPGPATMYGIASVSKIIATVATMKLVDQGRVQLDTPISLYIPEFSMLSPSYRQITVRMLLDHSAGFPGATYGNGSTTAYYPGYLDQVLATLADSRLKTTPGYMSVYCNDGFTMLEALIRDVTGESYAQYVQDEVFTPLGMTHTAYPLAPFADGTYAKAYDGDVAKSPEVPNSLASGGLYSTPTDLGRLGTMLMDRGTYGGARVLSTAAVAEMGTDQTLGSFNPVSSAAVRYGLGWDTVTEPASHAAGVTAWAKNGGIIDYHSSFMVAPKAKLTVSVLATSPLGTESCDALARRVLVHALLDQGTIRRLPGPVSETPPPVKRATQAQLAAMLGIWAKSDGLYRVEPSAGDPQVLVMSMLKDGRWVPIIGALRFRTDGRFHGSHAAGGFAPINAGGRTYLVYTSPGDYAYYLNSFLFLQKLHPGDPLSAAWQGRVGHSWLAANAVPTCEVLGMDTGPQLQVGEVPGLPGFVTVTTLDYSTQTLDTSRSDTVGTMFLQIPGVGSRDMEDAVFTRHGADEWVGWGDTVYRPKATVPVLADGANTVDFGAEGYAEWRTLAASAAVHISAGTAWYLYDGDLKVLGSGTSLPADVSAPAGSYLLLYGPAGTSSTLTVATD